MTVRVTSQGNIGNIYITAYSDGSYRLSYVDFGIGYITCRFLDCRLADALELFTAMLGKGENQDFVASGRRMLVADDSPQLTQLFRV